MSKKTGAIAAVVVGLLLVMAYLVDQGQRVNFNEGYQPEQPIAFSHKIHAGDNQIQCLYCHFGAEQGRHAGVPPTELCLNCHKITKKDSPEVQKIHQALKSGEPVAWIKVNHFPDFAYFNHAQHVKVGKVSCQECHGPVETMDRVKQVGNLSMGWCLDCHRQKNISPPNDHKSAKGGDCARCHY